MESRKPISNYQWLYEVSNMWQIKSLQKILKTCGWWYRTQKELIKKQQLEKNGYYSIQLSNKDWYSKFSVHRLVAEAFLPNPDNKRTVNHINWIRNDNRLENLERMTYSQNSKDWFNRWRKPTCHWTGKFWKDNPWSKKVNQYTLDWVFIKTFDWISDAARSVWWHSWPICNYLKWRVKKAYWYKRAYFNS